MREISSNAVNERVNYGVPSDNLLIFGENLKVLKQIDGSFRGKIQCIYLDPPYNSCNSFIMFKDSLSQDEWERTMSERLCTLWPFLSQTGSIWISIDDSEFADLKVLCDKIWGREHFVLCIVRQKNKYPSSVERPIVHMHDYILVYAKDPDCVKLNAISPEQSEMFSDDKYRLENLLIWKSALDPKQDMDEHIYQIQTPSGKSITPPEERCWSVSYDNFIKLNEKGAIWFGEETVFPYIKHPVHKNNRVRPVSIWLEKDVGSNQEARFEISNYDAGEFFYVPKPERLLYMILSICTDPGDWVLDPYLGSGTTAAVSHKMSRNWIGIERGKKQFFDICLPRLQDVIMGKEGTAVTRAVNWRGGGGFQCIQYDVD